MQSVFLDTASLGVKLHNVSYFDNKFNLFT